MMIANLGAITLAKMNLHPTTYHGLLTYLLQPPKRKKKATHSVTLH